MRCGSGLAVDRAADVVADAAFQCPLQVVLGIEILEQEMFLQLKTEKKNEQNFFNYLII